MRGKLSGLITVSGGPDVQAADPIVQSFRTTTEMSKMHWLGSLMASANDRGEIMGDDKAMAEAFLLGKKAATP